MNLIVTVTSYDKDTNTCEAITSTGVYVGFDPFAGCAIDMTDEQYKDGYGFTVVGNTYCLTEYTSRDNHVVVHEGGIVFLYKERSK